MPRVVINQGYAIGYAESGTGNALPMIFLHGVGSDKSVWRCQLDHFGQSRRTLAFDYPGYGDSDPAPDGIGRDDYALAIISAMHELGVERAHVCGLSLGGVVAIAIHSAARERVASLILADTFAAHPDGRALFERSVTGSTDLPAMAQARIDYLLAQPADPRIRKQVVETMAGINPAAYRIGAEAVWLADQRDRARDIRVPTLVLCGDQDRPTPPELSAELHALIPGSLLKIIQPAGHLTNLEQPASFNRIVDKFLASLEAAPL